jgi:cytochrome c-type biogenesis protein CcmH
MMTLHKKRLGRYFLCLLFGLMVLLSAITAGIVWGQVPTPSDDDINRIASQLYCPICDNISLDVCPLEACQSWRDLIREQLAEGWTEREIKDYFVAQYGDRVLGAPPARGLNWILYLAPPILILLGFVVLLSKMRRSLQEERAPNETSNRDPYFEQVERDLRNLD